MSAPGPGPDYTGCYRICQDKMYLSSDGQRAITEPLNLGGQFVWHVTHADPTPSGDSSSDLIYPGLTFHLLPSGSIEPFPGRLPLCPVLTLAGVNELVPIPILVEMPRRAPSRDQQWMLSEVKPSKPIPAKFTAHILPVAKEGSVAATILNAQEMPVPRQFVEAVEQGMPEINGLWTFERILE